jgi:peroxiredoxin-like protein
MPQAHYYDVSVEWTAGRKGILKSDVLPLSIEVATPPEFSNGIAGTWSPEHLFVAAVNSCLMTTFLAIAENSRLRYESFGSNAIGKLENSSGKFLMSEVVLRPVLRIMDENDREKAMRVLEKSEKACLVSNSIKSKIVFEPLVEIANGMMAEQPGI